VVGNYRRGSIDKIDALFQLIERASDVEAGEFGEQHVADLLAPYHRMLDTVEKEIVRAGGKPPEDEEEDSEIISKLPFSAPDSQDTPRHSRTHRTHRPPVHQTPQALQSATEPTGPTGPQCTRHPRHYRVLQMPQTLQVRESTEV
jgi:hypothetical protein